jgi:hypothetical protein
MNLYKLILLNHSPKLARHGFNGGIFTIFPSNLNK